ncbi:MAG TPA: sugar transferase [Puia sp.]|jgi:lipopolysaccharide/colanic/teichoic acid biosynthesis glycosyltransferase|nr:sugar transferase [Puia sp.]
MDLLFLPLSAQKSEDKKATPQFTFRSFQLHHHQVKEFQYDGFYYIGKNTASVEKLGQLYDRGYIAEDLEHVKNELSRNLKANSFLPHVIFCETTMDPVVIGQFQQFLRNHVYFRVIPFILECTELSAKELAVYRKNARPDEMLTIANCGAAKLKAKVNFLQKMKKGMSKNNSPLIEERVRWSERPPFSKRLFDILVASIALLLLSPIMLLIAIAIKLESKGPVFYIAKRAGRGYRIFNFYKFRTMVTGADKKIGELTHLNQYNGGSSALFFKINNDPRITRVGTFLRNTSLDELPQLLNVLVGDMSLVGNRPLPLYEAASLTTDGYAARFMAPAGITGLWQIKKRGNKDMSVEERINIDIDYVSKCNFMTDFWIIANTPLALVQKENV